MTLTRHRGRDSAPQSGHCGHGNLLRGELLRAGVSRSDHVGLQQSTLQVNVVVGQSLVYSRQNLQMKGQIYYHSCFKMSSEGEPFYCRQCQKMMYQPFLWHTGSAAGHGLRQAGSLAQQ